MRWINPFRSLWLSSFLLFFIAACGGGTTEPAPPVAPAQILVDASAAADDVFVLRASQRQALPAPQQIDLQVGDGVDVQGQGEARLVFLPDLLGVTVMRDGQLTVSQIDVNQQAAEITLLQNLGTFVNDFNPNAEIEKRLRVESDFAIITATGTRFMVVKEANTPLEWIFGLEAGEADLMVQAKNDPNPDQPTLKSTSSGMARWIAPVGVPSAGIPYQVDAVNKWLAAVDAGQDVPEVGEILWPFAEAQINTGTMPPAPVMDTVFDWGGVQTTLAGQSALGVPRYERIDCNGDGILDIYVGRGEVRLDFRTLPNRVRGVDLTVMALDLAAGGSLSVENPGLETVNRQPFAIAPGTGSLLSLWSEEAVHYAVLAMTDGCLLGLTLQPPLADGSPPPPRPAIDAWPLTADPPPPSPTATPVSDLPLPPVEDGSQLVAVALKSALIMDGKPTDWLQLQDVTGRQATAFTANVWDQACANRYPSRYAQAVDLSAQVAFAYTADALYVAFWVADDGFVGFGGPGYNYFQSDSPQLMLDLDWAGDRSTSTLNGDDKQIDFLTGAEQIGDSPRAALWDLGPGTPQGRSVELAMAASPTEEGYFLEATIPWSLLNYSPQPGSVLGLAASVSDNDSVGTNVQECMISTAPNRKWDNPTTWGTLLLESN